MSLLCRLKKIVHKGLLKQEDLDRIVIIPKEPSDDTVSRGVFEQIKWERDVAIEQLEELGYRLGQKIEPCKDCISRNKVLEGKVIHQSCDGVEIINGYAVPVEYIEQLPPVKPKTDVLYHIKAEIKETYEAIDDVCIRNGLNLARRIIDKYTAESEE